MTNTNNDVRYVMSLGSNCVASMTCKDAGLKRFSGPFDWLFVNMETVKDCIIDNFSKFLDKNLYVPHNYWTRSDRHAGHSLYGANLFEHHDPRRPAVHAYFTRCVERFQSVLASPHRKLFIMSFLDGRLPDSYQPLIDFYEWLKTRTPNFVLFILCYVEGSPRQVDTYEFVHDNGGLVVKGFYTMGGHAGIRLKNEDDNAYMVKYLRDAFNYDLLTFPLINLDNIHDY